MTDPAPYSVPKEPGRWRAITLALVVHVALLVFLWVGVHWQSETPVGVEAEIWSPQNHEAAPRPEPPPIEKRPEPEPKAEPKPQPVIKETPKPPTAEPIRENPEIALEQEKKRKAAEKREREEHEKQVKLKQKLEQEREEKQKQVEQERIDKKKAEAQERQKAEAQAQKEKEEAAAAQAKKIAAEKKRKQDALDAAAADQRRAEDMKRMMTQAGTGGTGNAPTAQGSRADTSYTQKVAARIKSNTVFNLPDGLAGNPAVEFAVELLPDGSIRALNKMKSSGVSGFDEAVQRAIGKSAPFPPDKTGRVPASFNVVHHPKDQ